MTPTHIFPLGSVWIDRKISYLEEYNLQSHRIKGLKSLLLTQQQDKPPPFCLCHPKSLSAQKENLTQNREFKVLLT